MALNPRGFRAARHLAGHTTFRTTTYQVDDSNPKIIYQGMAVVLSSGKVVEYSAAGTVQPVLGVVKSVYSATKNRPRTHSLPTTANLVPASTAAYVDVYTDPDIVYNVVANSAMNLADIGQGCEIVASPSGNPNTGVSRMAINTTTFAAITSANQDSLPFLAVGLAPESVSPAGNGYGRGNAAAIEVVINNHIMRPKPDAS